MNNIEFIAQTKIKITFETPFETPLATSILPPKNNHDKKKRSNRLL